MSVSLGRVPRAVYALVALATCALASLPAQTSLRARLLGVYDARTGDAVEGAQVLDVASGTSALTTRTGTVSLGFLIDSGSMVRVQKIGYRAQMLLVKTTPTDTLPVTVVLEPIATTLPTVVTKDSTRRYISPGLQAFEERRAMGHGRFINEAELRKNDNRSMTNVLRSAGVRVGCSARTPIRCFPLSMRESCELEVYMDGIRVNRDERDLEKIFVNTIGGVEIYFGPATIPPLYNQTGSRCGIVLFWTRER